METFFSILRGLGASQHFGEDENEEFNLDYPYVKFKTVILDESTATFAAPQVYVPSLHGFVLNNVEPELEKVELFKHTIHLSNGDDTLDLIFTYPSRVTLVYDDGADGVSFQLKGNSVEQVIGEITNVMRSSDEGWVQEFVRIMKKCGRNMRGGEHETTVSVEIVMKENRDARDGHPLLVSPVPLHFEPPHPKPHTIDYYVAAVDYVPSEIEAHDALREGYLEFPQSVLNFIGGAELDDAAEEEAKDFISGIEGDESAEYEVVDEVEVAREKALEFRTLADNNQCFPVISSLTLEGSFNVNDAVPPSYEDSDTGSYDSGYDSDATEVPDSAPPHHGTHHGTHHDTHHGAGVGSTSRPATQSESKDDVAEAESKHGDEVLASMDPRLATFGLVHEMTKKALAWFQGLVLRGTRNSGDQTIPTLTIHPASLAPLCPMETPVSMRVGDTPNNTFSFVTIDNVKGDILTTGCSLSCVLRTPYPELNSFLKPVIDIRFARSPDGISVGVDLDPYPLDSIQSLVELCNELFKKNKEMTSADLRFNIGDALDKKAWRQGMKENDAANTWVPQDEGLTYAAPSFISIQSPPLKLDPKVIALGVGPILFEMLWSGSHRKANDANKRRCWMPSAADGWILKAKDTHMVPTYMLNLIQTWPGHLITTEFDFRLARQSPTKTASRIFAGKKHFGPSEETTVEEIRRDPLQTFIVQGACHLQNIGAIYRARLQALAAKPSPFPCVSSLDKARALTSNPQAVIHELALAGRAYVQNQEKAKEALRKRARTGSDKEQKQAERELALIKVLGRLGETGTLGTPGERKKWVDTFCSYPMDILTGEDLDPSKSVAILTQFGKTPYGKSECVSVEYIRRITADALNPDSLPVPMKEYLLLPPHALEALRKSRMYGDIIPNPASGAGYDPDYEVRGVPPDHTPTYYLIPIGGARYLILESSVRLLLQAIPGDVFMLVQGNKIRYGNADGGRGVSQTHGQVTDFTYQVIKVGNFSDQDAKPVPYSWLARVSEFL